MRGHDSERGVTLVEYALLVALVALAAVPAIGALRDATLDEYERTLPGAPHAESPATTTTAPPPTAPPTTAPPPTTAAPTTSPPPTTAPPVVASAGFSNVTSGSAGWFRWAGSADVVVRDAAGRALAGARVDVRVTTSTGSVQTVTVTTDATGRATVGVGPYYDGWGGVARADLRVTGVTPTGGTWDGTAATTSIHAP